MTPRTDRRAILLAAGVAAVAALTAPAAAQTTEVRGEVTYEGGAIIPAGEVGIYLEGGADRDVAGQAAARVRSDGKSKSIAFVLPAVENTSRAVGIVARLEREDGWLLARGSAASGAAGALIHVTMNAAIY